MKYTKLIGTLCLTLFISGCIPQPNVVKVENPELRMSQQGYSLIPTNETGWIIQARSSYQLALIRKENLDSDETFVIQATLFNLPSFNDNQELLSMVKKGQEVDTNPARFTVKMNEVINYVHQEVDCIRSHLLTIDNAAIRESESTDKMLLEAVSLVCPHPDDKSIGISISYSQRYYKSKQTPRFTERANVVINSVKFEKLKI